MLKLFKFFFIFLLVISLVFPFELNQTEAASTTLSKTVEFFVGQESAVKASGEQIFFLFTVNIPETPIITSAIIEISGVSYNDPDSGDQTVNIDLKKNPNPQGPGIDYVIGVTNKPKNFSFKFDASSIILSSDFPVPGGNTYSLYIKNTVTGGLFSFSIASAKLILTYNYSSSGANFLKANKFFISQEKDVILSGSEIKRDFTLTVPESSPEARSIFVELIGNAKGTGTNNTIQLSVVKEGLPVYNTYNIDLSALPANSKFIIRYDMTALIDPLDFPVGNYSLYVKNSFDAYLLGVKAIITYKYSVITGGLPAKGELISSTIDTGIAGGAAYNSLMWKGNLNGGLVEQVGLQIAASGSINGPWNFEGPDCTSATSYNAEPNLPIPIEIACASSHNNKRYFRYKVIICSNADCATSGLINPRVDDVAVNWGQ